MRKRTNLSGCSIIAVFLLGMASTPLFAVSAATTVIVDDLDSGFTKYGTASYWHEATVGYKGHMFWTWNGVSVIDNYARWQPSLSGAGTYAVSVFIPSDKANTANANYKILHNGVTDTHPVNQSPYADVWVGLGDWYFSSAGGEYVQLADATGEALASKWVGFDAVSLTPVSSTRLLGLDVSYSQASIDWTQVHNSSKSFAFVRATYGTGNTDTWFQNNAVNATTAEMLWGAYHFAYPTLTPSAVAEADWFVSVAGPYITAGHLRPALDIEDDPASGSFPGRDLEKTGLSQWVNSWMTEMRRLTGVDAIIYCNQTYAKLYLDATVTGHALWIANPTGNPNGTPSTTGPWPTWMFQQYDWHGACPGVSGEALLDVFHGDIAALNSYVIGGGQTLNVSLTAQPSSGTAPLNGVDLTATVSGTATGTINYTFYANRSDDGTNITPGYCFKIDGRNPDGTAGTVIYQGIATGWTGGTTFTVYDVHNYTSAGTYSAKVIAERGSAPPAEQRVTITVSTPPCSVTPPTTPSGPSSGQTGQSLSYSTGGSTCSNGHSVQYRFDWGDGSGYSSWGSSTQSHTYSSASTYTIKAQAHCASTFTESNWSSGKSVTISLPPCSVTTPTTPSGPSSGQTGQSLSYSTGGSTCSNGHSVQYRFDWGDGSGYSSWSSSLTQSHIYTSANTYTVRAQARCASTYVESTWSSGKSVTISQPNTYPSLSSGQVSPSFGDPNTSFYYYVNYYDQDGDAPAMRYVYIDGAPYTMALYSGTASNGTYYYATMLPIGDHSYYFYFEDGRGGTAWWPSTQSTK